MATKIKIITNIVPQAEKIYLWCHGHCYNSYSPEPHLISSIDAYDILNSKTRKFDRVDPNSTLSKLIEAIASFGDAGCNACEANDKAHLGRYVADGHPFANLGVFVELASGRKNARTPMRVLYDLTTDDVPKYEYNRGAQIVAIDRVSRNHNNKYRLSAAGKKLLANIRENVRFYDVWTTVNDMIHDPNGIDNYIINRTLKGDPVDVDIIFQRAKALMNDEVMMDRFGSKIKSLCKTLAPICHN